MIVHTSTGQTISFSANRTLRTSNTTYRNSMTMPKILFICHLLAAMTMITAINMMKSKKIEHTIPALLTLIGSWKMAAYSSQGIGRLKHKDNVSLKHVQLLDISCLTDEEAHVFYLSKWELFSMILCMFYGKWLVTQSAWGSRFSFNCLNINNVRITCIFLTYFFFNEFITSIVFGLN